MRRLLLLLLLPLLASCASDDRTRIIIYSPHGKELLRAYEEAFEAANPTVDVVWNNMGGQDVSQRINTEKVNPQASLWWGGASMTFARAAREGLLEPYQPSWHAEVGPQTHDAAHHWYGTYFTPEVIAFNDEVLSDSTAPADWDDLLDPAWEGRILIRYPLGSSTMVTIWGAMIQRQPTVAEGYAWLARLDRNVKTYTADPTQLYLKLARGEGDVTLWNMPDVYLQSLDNGYPFDYRLPPAGTPVLVDGIALVKGGPNLDVARQFYEFVTTDSALVRQAHDFYRIPVRQDIDPAQLPAWMTEQDITPLPLDWDRLTEDVPTWMQYWDENIKGRGAAYLREQGLE